MDIADIQLISKYIKGIRYFLYAIDLFSKYAWVVPLKDLKDILINAFQSTLDRSNRKPNKIWVDQGSEFYNRPFKKWLKENHIEMYWKYNQGKSVVAERFVKNIKTFLLKDMLQIGQKKFLWSAKLKIQFHGHTLLMI